MIKRKRGIKVLSILDLGFIYIISLVIVILLLAFLNCLIILCRKTTN